MEHFPRKQTDTLNTVAIVVIGLAGALLVYISAVALQAFYRNESTELLAQRDSWGMSSDLDALRSEQEAKLIGKLEPAEQAVIAQLRSGRGGSLVPSVGSQDKATIPPVVGYYDPMKGTAAAPQAPTAEGAGSATPAGEAEAAPAESAPTTPGAPAAEGDTAADKAMTEREAGKSAAAPEEAAKVQGAAAGQGGAAPAVPQRNAVKEGEAESDEPAEAPRARATKKPAAAADQAETPSQRKQRPAPAREQDGAAPNGTKTPRKDDGADR